MSTAIPWTTPPGVAWPGICICSRAQPSPGKRYKQNQREIFLLYRIQNYINHTYVVGPHNCTKKQIQVLCSTTMKRNGSRAMTKDPFFLAFGLFKPSCSQRCLKPVHWTCRSLFRVFRMHNHNRSQISLAKTFHAAKAVVLQNGWTDMDFLISYRWYVAPSCTFPAFLALVSLVSCIFHRPIYCRVALFVDSFQHHP